MIIFLEVNILKENQKSNEELEKKSAGLRKKEWQSSRRKRTIETLVFNKGKFLISLFQIQVLIK